MLRFNPHFHAIVLEGGFDNEGTFFYIPFSGLQAMVEVFRRRVIKLLVARELLNEDFAQNLHMFDAFDFLAELTLHIPPKPLQLIRRYGLYASRTKGRWE